MLIRKGTEAVVQRSGLNEKDKGLFADYLDLILGDTDEGAQLTRPTEQNIFEGRKERSSTNAKFTAAQSDFPEHLGVPRLDKLNLATLFLVTSYKKYMLGLPEFRGTSSPITPDKACILYCERAKG